MPPEPEQPRPFPIDALAPWQRDMVRAVSVEAQTDPAMAAMFCLGFSAFTVGRNVQLAGASGPGDPLALWVVVIAESGEGKSRTFSPLIAPLARLDRALRGAAAEPEPVHASDIAVGPTAWERLMSRDLIDDADRETEQPARRAPWATHDAVLAVLVAEQAARFPNAPLRFLQRSVTPEALVEVIANQAPGVVQASPEAQFFTHVASGGPKAVASLANYNSMWSGEDIQQARIGRTASSAIRPVLTLVVAPQPEAFAEICSGRLGRLIERTGFLMRCWFCHPRSNIGRRAPRSQPIPDDVRLAYEENLRAMFATANTNVLQPHTLRLESHREWEAFFTDVERRRARGGDLHRLAGWATRVRQGTARIAGMLHVAQHAGEFREETFRRPVSRETFERAIEIGRWQLEHGRSVLLASGGTDLGTPEGGTDLVTMIRTLVAARGEWVGTATELLEALRRAAPDDPELPTAANQLMRLLGECDLHAAGILMTDQRTARTRTYRLTLVNESNTDSSSSPSSS